MKKLLLLAMAMVHGCMCPGAFAQTTPNTQTYFQNLPTGVNLIKNPDGRLNALDVTKTGTVVVTATASSGNDPSYFSIGAISTLGYAEFDLRPVKSDMTSGQCEFKGKYFGTEASKYSARIFNGTTEVIKVVLQNTTSDLPNGGPWKEFSVGAPCSSNPKARIYVDAVGLSLGVNRLYYDKATNIGTYNPPTEFSATVNGTTGALTSATPFGSSPLSVSASISDTSLYSIPLSGLSSSPNCNVSPLSNNSTSTLSASIVSLTSSSVQVRTGLVPVGASPNSITKTPIDFVLRCNKTGQESAVPIVSTQNLDSYERIFFTPTMTGLGSGSGSFTPSNWNYYTTNGMNANICYRFVKDATAGTGSTTLRMSLPPAITVDSSTASAMGPLFTNMPGVSPATLELNTGTVVITSASGATATGASATANSVIAGCITIPTTSKKPTNGAVIVNAVTTKVPGVLKQSALIECSATSSVVASIGSWASISNISGNRCNISMSGFTQNPICTAVVNSVETTNSRTVHLNVTSPTAMSIGCVNQLGGATSACTNSQFYLDCAGF